MPKPIPVFFSLAATALLVVPSATPDQAEIQAAFRDGTIAVEEFESWRNHRTATARNSNTSTDKDFIEELVILRVLVDRFQSMGLDHAAANIALLSLREWEISSNQLRQSVVRAARPSEADLKEAFEADPGRFARPRQWRLENIFKRWPKPCPNAQHDEIYLSWRPCVGESSLVRTSPLSLEKNHTPRPDYEAADWGLPPRRVAT